MVEPEDEPESMGAMICVGEAPRTTAVGDIGSATNVGETARTVGEKGCATSVGEMALAGGEGSSASSVGETAPPPLAVGYCC